MRQLAAAADAARAGRTPDPWLSSARHHVSLFAALRMFPRNDRCVVPQPPELEGVIEHYLQCTNEVPKPFWWTKTADEILGSVAPDWPSRPPLLWVATV